MIYPVFTTHELHSLSYPWLLQHCVYSYVYYVFYPIYLQGFIHLRWLFGISCINHICSLPRLVKYYVLALLHLDAVFFLSKDRELVVFAQEILTYPQFKGTFEDHFPNFPRWDRWSFPGGYSFLCEWWHHETGSTIRTLLHGKINPKDWQVLSLGDVGFLLFFRVVSGDYGKPSQILRIQCWTTGLPFPMFGDSDDDDRYVDVFQCTIWFARGIFVFWNIVIPSKLSSPKISSKWHC